MVKGSKHSQESKRKVVEAKKLYYLTHSSPRKGKKFTPEQLKKLSDSHIGIKATLRQIEVLDKGRKKYHESIYVEGKSNNPKYRIWINSLNGYRRREAGRLYGNPHTNKQWEELKIKYDFICPGCLKKEPEIKLTRDHIISLSKGGSDSIENIQPLCKICNSKKHTKSIKY